MTYAQRLREVFELLESDLRVQVVFTVAPHAFSEGVTDYLRSMGIEVIPWKLALATEFDVALAAGSQGIDQLRARVIRLSHGAGHIKLLRRPAGHTVGAPRTGGMLSRQHLVRDGKVVPAAVAFSHERDLEVLAESCPEALPVASVVGDPSHDRILASLPHRARYREALGLRPGERLVVVPSTWGVSSSFGHLGSLLPRLLAELPPGRFRVAVLAHPNVWAGHGGWQVRAWLSDCRRRGIALVPPEDDWQSLLVAGDWIIGDHGSVTAYGALARVPILMARYPAREVTADSPTAVLARVAPALSPLHPLEDQLRYAADHYRPAAYEPVAARISSAPGAYRRRMRALLYAQLGLSEPAYPVRTEPAPVPPCLDAWTGGRPELLA
ncbi:hypothetical protein ACWGJ2_17565 [Streptomyces sp. NPDC054796]